MSNLGRELTIRLTITDPAEAEWLWECAAKRKPVHGVQVTALANGDMFKERDELAQAAEFYIKEPNEDVKTAVSSHFDGGFGSIDEAAYHAKEMVAWEVIDRRGNVYRKSE